MNKRVKKLSLAIYWHMHQPVYELEGTYLMPWVRLHAVKDYLDMVLILEKFPKLKLNFNIVPALLDAILDYTENGYHDIHSELTVSDTENLTDEEKQEKCNYLISNGANYGLKGDETAKVADTSINNMLDILKKSNYKFIAEEIKENEQDYAGSFRIIIY